VPYRIEGAAQQYRINYPGLRQLREEGRRLTYDLIVLDLDPPGHGEGWSAQQIFDWQRQTMIKLAEAEPEYYATAGAYATRAGLRLLWELPGVDEARYVGLHTALRARLRKAGIPVDDGTGEFNRLYRLPRATRDGVLLSGAVDLERLDELPDLDAVPVDPLASRKRLEVDGPTLGRDLPVLIKDGEKNQEIMALLGYCRRHGADVRLLHDVLSLYLRAGLIEGGDTIDAGWIRDAVRSMAAKEVHRPEGREYVRWSDAECGEIAREIATLLGKSGRVYQRAGRLAYVGADDEGAMLVQGISKDSLRYWIPQVVELTGIKKKEEFEIAPPDKLLGTLHASPVLWGEVPVVRGVTACPIIRADGSILDVAGYDRASGYYYDPAGVEYPPVPTEPSRKDAIAAAGRVWETVLKDYSFEGPAHLSVALAVPLTVLGRRLFDGPSPLFLIDAAQRGAGKSLLAKAWSLVVLGRPAPVAALCDEAEAEKRVTVLLRDAAPLVVFDDVKGQIGAEGVLDRLITSDVWWGRILGASEPVSLANRACWVATGRNATVGGDMERRTLLCRLDPGVADPASRTGLPELEAVIPPKRPQLVCDLLTVLRAYWVAGQPQADLEGYGSFGGWSRAIRQCLVWLGLPDPVATRAEVRERADVAGNATEALLHAWFGLYGANEQTSQDVMRTCAMADNDDARVLRDSLIALGAYNDSGKTNAYKLGISLSKIEGARIENLKFRRRKQSGRWLYFTNEVTLW
jgi:hypothetical protein